MERVDRGRVRRARNPTIAKQRITPPPFGKSAVQKNGRRSRRNAARTVELAPRAYFDSLLLREQGLHDRVGVIEREVAHLDVPHLAGFVEEERRGIAVEIGNLLDRRRIDQRERIIDIVLLREL